MKDSQMIDSTTLATIIGGQAATNPWPERQECSASALTELYRQNPAQAWSQAAACVDESRRNAPSAPRS
jgi:hypothetical protein